MQEHFLRSIYRTGGIYRFFVFCFSLVVFDGLIITSLRIFVNTFLCFYAIIFIYLFYYMFIFYNLFVFFIIFC